MEDLHTTVQRLVALRDQLERGLETALQERDEAIREREAALSEIRHSLAAYGAPPPAEGQTLVSQLGDLLEQLDKTLPHEDGEGCPTYSDGCRCTVGALRLAVRDVGGLDSLLKTAIAERDRAEIALATLNDLRWIDSHGIECHGAVMVRVVREAISNAGRDRVAEIAREQAKTKEARESLEDMTRAAVHFLRCLHGGPSSDEEALEVVKHRAAELRKERR